MNEYKERDKEIESLIQKRKRQTNYQGMWDYNHEVGKSTQQPFKYQNVKESTVELDQLKEIIFDEGVHPDDLRLFAGTQWNLTPISEKVILPPSKIPSIAYLKSKDEKEKQKELDSYYGRVEMHGQIEGKANEINYNTYHYNLRSNVLTFYRSKRVDDGNRELICILLNEKTFDFQSNSMEYVVLKGQAKNMRVLKNQRSSDLLKNLQKKLMYYSFRGAYALRNQVPSYKVQDYLLQQIDTIGPINFDNESHIKQIAKSAYYRQTIGAFFSLLQRVSRKRNNKAAQIQLPRWLKQQFKNIPLVDMWLSTNLSPQANSLLSLKIKVNNNEKEGMIHSLKYVFPYLQQSIKRTFIVYESELEDDELVRIMNILNYPFYALGFPRNKLSASGLIHAVQKSADTWNQILDFSYNSKLTGIGGSKLMNTLNNNPTLKKLYLKGSYITEGDEDTFFESLKSNLTLLQLQLDYMEHYNESMVQFLQNFQAIME